jgi:TPR repeat protein
LGKTPLRELGVKLSQDDENKDNEFESLYIKDFHFSAGFVKSFRLNRDKLGAKVGLYSALFNMGLRYEFGKEVPLNLSHALYCYNRANERGHKAAEDRIKVILEANKLLEEEMPELLKPVF